MASKASFSADITIAIAGASGTVLITPGKAFRADRVLLSDRRNIAPIANETLLLSLTREKAAVTTATAFVVVDPAAVDTESALGFVVPAGEDASIQLQVSPALGVAGTWQVTLIGLLAD